MPARTPAKTATATVIPTPAPGSTPPAPPALPKSWTLSTTLVFAGGCALFLLGILTQAGVTVPASVSSDVRLVVGAINEIAGGLTLLGAHVTNSSVVKYLASLTAPVES